MVSFPIDLKSDTVTKPSAAMRKAMSEAEVGDDVYGEDPTVARLEHTAAELLGKEAALYVTSGTQGNLVSLLTHCGHGDSVIIGRGAHILNFEGGGLCSLGGIFPIPVDDASGLPALADLDPAVPDVTNVHFTRARLLCLENTHNRAGGQASAPEKTRALADWAHGRGLAVHMDGARIFNAAAAFGTNASEMAQGMDSVQICLSKGLGAPMGSLICASRDFIERARFWRKKVGGGLRQAGIVAAAGLYALEHNVARLREDHENAALIGAILKNAGITVSSAARPTNMIYFKAKSAELADALRSACLRRGVVFNKSAPDSFRLVTHLDVSREQAETAAKVIAEEYGSL
ncbi:MAG: low-specificity L-threonine aldolase [Synergistaceae bacterium]|jgi:threonine aldolase|nr:low-specificity L-threonine aldolase [Synergistaceae bacterium]